MNETPYLSAFREELRRSWPGNRTLNIVCHGHSVPAGYFATPVVDTFNPNRGGHDLIVGELLPWFAPEEN